MARRFSAPRRAILLAAAIVASFASTAAFAQVEPRQRLREPVYRVAQAPQENSSAGDMTAAAPTTVEQPAAATDHPLVPVLDMAYRGLKRMDDDVKDYTATLVKRERIDGRLNDHEYIFVKVRQKPFSVYMYFLGPKGIRGREVLYDEGKNVDTASGRSKLKAHEGSGIKALVTVDILPDSALAMRGQRYPITEVGIRTLTQRLIEVGEQDKKYGECDVKFFQGAKVQDRVCTCLQVEHPVRRQNFRFHLARVYIDDELQIPIRYESYDWPQAADGRPVLLEEYTYMKLQLNVGLTDADFDPENPNYKF